MPKIETLVEDIYGLFREGAPKIEAKDAEQFGHDMADMLVSRLSEVREPPRLRLSNLGKPCSRQLWYTINTPELAEPLPPATRIKFLFGDVIEALALFLAKVSGHEVTDLQREVEVAGVRGRIDAKIDGELVDVKSASAYSFRKFQDGLKPADDSFGYLTQLSSYSVGSGVERSHFLVVEKEKGKLHLDTHEINTTEQDLLSLVDRRRSELSKPSPPARGFNDAPEGASGNRKLTVNCSYCPFHKTCWPGLRMFYYSGKPVFLTTVVREPKVDENKDF